ncbi:MAG: pilus assembly protein TadG-related protein [Gemmatimonadota bacterium]
MKRQPISRWRDERGSVLILAAFALLGLVAIAAFGIDLGLLYVARTESQRVADLSALAGAGKLAEELNAAPAVRDALAKQEAVDYAAKNYIRNETAVVQLGDVQVIQGGDVDTVRVTVRNTLARSNPILTFFARVIGINQVDVVTVAAAEVSSAGLLGVVCPLPVTLPDKWIDDGFPEWTPPPDGGDLYDPDADPPIGGYTEADIGTLLLLKPSQGGTSKGQNPRPDPDGARFEPGWWYLWLPDFLKGANDAREAILDCPTDPNGDPLVITEGEWLSDKNGNVQTLERAFEDVIAKDPTAVWPDGCTAGVSCIQNSCVSNGTCPQFAVSPRLRSVPVFDPRFYCKTCADNFQVQDFFLMWIDSVDPGPPGKRNVYARIAGGAGIGFGDDTEGPANKIVRRIRLVE